ncbi:hypothetical protein [Oleiagrimonas sp.]|jgi:hypothetical protein|uniref:hypothetical protein n=1 Tax=Oleiagrimonas sp. TaxID=2010330 RepID=UPI00262DC61B|nr:hypothetical protein [Oleiagrimonas sp.]MDA3914730.1 hypothetical protein [Oleiagrimonas sp.]
MKIVMFCGVALVASLLSACATNSGVLPIGGGNYELTGTGATAFNSGVGVKGDLLKQANSYCSKLGKSMVLGQAETENAHMGSFANVNGSSSNRAGGSGSINGSYIHPGTKASADIIFHCE